jgi:SP family sugar:H+ symporter-like MFS transporter
MPTLRNLTAEVQEKWTPNAAISKNTPRRSSSHKIPTMSTESQGRVSATAVTLGAVASIGGFIFGQ